MSHSVTRLGKLGQFVKGTNDKVVKLLLLGTSYWQLNFFFPLATLVGVQ